MKIKGFKIVFISLVICVLTAFIKPKAQEDNIKVLLVGDSTTIGNTPREVEPDRAHLEQMIEQLGAIEGLTNLDVVNAGKGGETAKRLLNSKHYDEAIASVKNVDVIFLRMGINDWFRCKDLEVEFPVQMKALINKLKEDHPKAIVYLCTITSFMKPAECKEVNDLIFKIGKDEKLDVLDIFTPYNNYLLNNGRNSLNVRQCYLSDIPKAYHEWLKPYTHYRKGWGNKPSGDVIKVNDMSIDPIFGHIKSWYNDRHPNSTGYNLIAAETVKFLKTRI